MPEGVLLKLAVWNAERLQLARDIRRAIGPDIAFMPILADDAVTEADERERAGLADLWNVEAVNRLSADLQIARWKKDGVRLKGRVKAQIVQACLRRDPDARYASADALGNDLRAWLDDRPIAAAPLSRKA